MSNDGRFDLKMMLKNFTDSQFVNQLVERFDKVFNDMNFITKLAFSKYHQFLADVQSFKTALLKFVLEAHLSGWMRIMESKGFKEASEEKQLAFIESRLSRISKDLLFEYLIQYRKLTKTSVDLHEEYGTTIFRVKYVLYNMKQVQEIRDNLLRTHDALVNVGERLFATNQKVVALQQTLKEKIDGESFVEVEDLREYVISTYEQFVKLEKTLLDMKIYSGEE